MKLVKKIASFVCISIAIEAINAYVKSPFILEFLQSKIVEILITLLAINTATSSFVVSKLQDISREKNVKFTDIYKEIKLSLIMQIVLICISILTLVIFKSEYLKPYLGQIVHIISVVLIFCFISAIAILRDTGVAMFDILIGMDTGKKDTD